MPCAAVGIVVVGVHGGGRHAGPCLAVQPEAAVELVADRECIVEVQRDQRGRHMAGETFDGAVTVTGWCQLRVASSFLL